MKTLLLLLLVGCAACGQSAVMQCRVAAALELPLDDPDSLTLGDTRRLAQRLKECDAPQGDAGR